MNVKNKNNETTSIPEAFQQLIPANAVSNVNKSMIAGEFLRLRYETAMSIKTDNPALAAEELARFKDNCRLANAISLGIELRNYLLWEIYSTEQYRQTDQDFVAFGMRMTELKKAQLMRSVHAGRIRIEMIQADLDDVRPTCRQVEALSKIEKKHTVNAWLHALAHVKVHARSDANFRKASSPSLDRMWAEPLDHDLMIYHAVDIHLTRELPWMIRGHGYK